MTVASLGQNAILKLENTGTNFIVVVVSQVSQSRIVLLTTRNLDAAQALFNGVHAAYIQADNIIRQQQFT